MKAPALLWHLVGQQVKVWSRSVGHLGNKVVTVLALDENGQRRLYEMYADDLGPADPHAPVGAKTSQIRNGFIPGAQVILLVDSGLVRKGTTVVIRRVLATLRDAHPEDTMMIVDCGHLDIVVFRQNLAIAPIVTVNETEQPALGGAMTQDLPSTGKPTGADKERGVGEVCRNCGAPAQRFVNPLGEEFVECTQSELHTRRLTAPSAEHLAHPAEQGTKKDGPVAPGKGRPDPSPADDYAPRSDDERRPRMDKPSEG